MLSDGAGAAEMVSFCTGRVESAEANCDGELTTEAGTTGANEDFLDFFTGKLCDFLGLEDDDVVEALWDARSGDGALGVEAARALSSGSGAAYRTLKCRRCGTVMDPSDSFVSEAGRVCAACVA